MLKFGSFHESSPADSQRGHDDLQEEIKPDTAFIRKQELLIRPGVEHQSVGSPSISKLIKLREHVDQHTEHLH